MNDLRNTKNSRPQGKKYYTRVAEVAFWLTSIFMLFYALGFRSLWGSEGRWAEIVREMFLCHDFFHPQINGQPYFDKPLFTYWVIVPASWISGSLNELAVRLPSAVAGLAAIWGIMRLGKRFRGDGTGLLAGAVLLASWGFCFWSRTAAADSENMAAIVLAVCWYFAFRERPGFWPYFGFYLICAAGVQFKGLTAVAVPIVALLPDILSRGRWKQYLSFSNGLALTLAIVVYLLPFVYAELTAKGYGESGLSLAFRENILRFFRAFDHKEPFYCYLYYVPLLFLPWVFLLVGAAVDRALNFRKLDENQRWLVLAVLAIFLLFTLSSSRRSYYIMPIIPFLALFVADFILRPANARIRSLTLSGQAVILFIAGLVLFVSPLLWPLIEAETGFAAPLSLKVIAAVAGGLALLFLASGRLDFMRKAVANNGLRRAIPMLLSAIVLLGGFFCFQQNSLEVYRTRKPFILKLKGLIPDIPPEMIGISKNMAGVVFYLDMQRPVIDVEKQGNLVKFLDQQGEKVIIARKKDAGKILPHLAAGSFKKILSSPEFVWSRRNDKGLVAWKIY